MQLFKKSSPPETTDIVRLEHLERTIGGHLGAQRRSGFSLESPGEPQLCQCQELGKGKERSGALEVIKAGARCKVPETADSLERLFLCCAVVLCCFPDPTGGLRRPSSRACLSIAAPTARDFSRHTHTRTHSQSAMCTCIEKAKRAI